MPSNVHIVDPNSRVAQIDGATHAMETIEYEHHEIHAGSHFFLCSVVSLGLNGTLDIVVTTPNTAKWAHVVWDVIGAVGGAGLALYEGTAHDGDGAAVTPINNNRNSATASDVVIQTDPTVTGVGTLILEARSGANNRAGTIGRDREIILKQNEDYLFRLTSYSATNFLSYCGEWYEHTDKA